MACAKGCNCCIKCFNHQKRKRQMSLRQSHMVFESLEVFAKSWNGYGVWPPHSPFLLLLYRRMELGSHVVEIFESRTSLCASWLLFSISIISYKYKYQITLSARLRTSEKKLSNIFIFIFTRIWTLIGTWLH